MEATKIARLTHLNRNTVNRLIKGVRERIAETCEREVRAAGGGATRLSGHAAPGIGRLHRAGELAHRMVGAQVLPDGRIHTWIVPAPAASEPQQQWPPIPSAAGPAPAPQASTGASPPARQRAGADELNRARSLDSFWGQTKLRLAKFKGISRRNYYLHLKESEFRFNHRREDLYRLLLELIRKRPLF